MYVGGSDIIQSSEMWLSVTFLETGSIEEEEEEEEEGKSVEVVVEVVTDFASLNSGSIT